MGTTFADMSPKIHMYLSNPSCSSHQGGWILESVSLAFSSLAQQLRPFLVELEVLGPAMDWWAIGGLNKPPLLATGALGCCKSCQEGGGVVGWAVGVGWEQGNIPPAGGRS